MELFAKIFIMVNSKLLIILLILDTWLGSECSSTCENYKIFKILMEIISLTSKNGIIVANSLHLKFRSV